MLLGGSDSRLQQSGPSGRAGPGNGAACGATPLLCCWPQHAVLLPALPAPAIVSSVSVPTMMRLIVHLFNYLCVFSTVAVVMVFTVGFLVCNNAC